MMNLQSAKHDSNDDQTSNSDESNSIETMELQSANMPTSVINSLDSLVLRRMRNSNSALEKLQTKTTTMTSESLPQHHQEPFDESQQHEEAEDEEVREPGCLSCPLCFELRPRKDAYVLNQCSHEFCRECITKWIEMGETPEHEMAQSCPFCRVSISAEDMAAILGRPLQPHDCFGPLTISPRIRQSEMAGLMMMAVNEREPFSFMSW